MLKKIDLHAEAQIVANSRTSVGGFLSIFVYLGVVAYTSVLVILDLSQPDIVTEMSAIGFLRDPVSLTIKAQAASIIPLFKTGDRQAGIERQSRCEEQLDLSTFEERTLKWQLYPFDPLPPVSCPEVALWTDKANPTASELSNYKMMHTKNYSDSMLVGSVSQEEYTFTTCPLPRALASGKYIAGGFLISFPTASKDNNISIGDHVLPKTAYELGYDRSYVCDDPPPQPDDLDAPLDTKQFAGLQIEGTSLRATREIRDGTTSPWKYKITEGLSRLVREYEDIFGDPQVSAAQLTSLPQRKLHQAFPTECALETKVCYLIAIKIPFTLEYTTIQYTKQRAGILTLIGAGLGTFGAFKVITGLIIMLSARIGGKSTTVVPKSETA